MGCSCWTGALSATANAFGGGCKGAGSAVAPCEEHGRKERLIVFAAQSLSARRNGECDLVHIGMKVGAPCQMLRSRRSSPDPRRNHGRDSVGASCAPR